ncbi:hypothetical protein [Cylindrospermopsis raciborskii]|uniref:hypothetical protein n=1 Tax=Cylindrospermopsis raciborskii TaxID=77022 RepID=UPI0022C0A7B1|nr:hypothetical protein [Cylindrospermopsis raciborskii]MCZ2207905.1 hypothetical protein [Cylindrospermopsis raciborskii PAMP2011]
MKAALQRPQQWHQEQRYKISQQWVDCWEVEFQIQEDYSKYFHFPSTPQGKKQALALQHQAHKKNLRQTKVQIKDILPHQIKISTPEWHRWCREWKI